MVPKSETELSEAIGSANGPLSVRGGGTRGLRVSGDFLSVAGISGITRYEPGALTIVVQAGTPVAEVEATLAAQNQQLAFEPMDHRALLGTTGVPTIGGVIAGNVSGPRRVQAGAARDFMLGVRFVDGCGRVLKNGGRVMKNVTGYDLVKLMTGSFGTLGVISEVSLKVLPRAETQACVMLRGLSDAQGVAAMSRGLGSPFEVTGAAHVPGGTGRQAMTMLRLEGVEASVSYRADELVGRLSRFGDIAVESVPEKVDRMWRDIRDVQVFAARGGDVWRISVKPSDGPRVGAALGDADLLYDWGGGLVWARVTEGTDLRTALADIPGRATLVRADQATRVRLGVFHAATGPLARISAGLRARFDPGGILNPGLMG